MGNTGFFVVSWSLVTFGNTNFLDAFHLQTTVWLLWQPKWMQPCLWSFLKGLNGRFTTDKGGFRTDKETLRNTSMDNFQMTPSLLQPVRLSWLSNSYSLSSLCVNSVEWMNVVFKYLAHLHILLLGWCFFTDPIRIILRYFFSVYQLTYFLLFSLYSLEQ